MRRILSISRPSRPQNRSEIREKNGPSPASSSWGNGTVHEDNEDNHSTSALMSSTTPAPAPNLKVKRVDYYYSNWSKSWKYRNTGSKVTPEAIRPLGGPDNNDPWQSFCFVVVRKMPKSQDIEQGAEPTFQVTIKSPYLLKACKDVIQNIPGLSWTAEPLELDPNLLLAFLPRFETYMNNLKGKKDRSEEESNILTTVEVLIDYLRKDYRGTLAKIANLTSHGEITFDLLFAIMVPQTVLITECPITGEPRALQLVSASLVHTLTGGYYDLMCESVDAVDESGTSSNNGGWAPMPSPDAQLRKAGGGKAFGKVQTRMLVGSFKGTVKINTLDVYPIKYHPGHVELERTLIARGRKWVSTRGIHHMHYHGLGAMAIGTGACKKYIKYNVNSRIMIDRANFKWLNPNYELPMVKGEGVQTQPNQWGNYTPVPLPPPDMSNVVPTLQVRTKTQRLDTELTEDELLLTPAVVYGFSLSDKIWLEFNIEHVTEIIWNDEAFSNLVLPAGRKTLLQSLVEAHNSDLGFDDFVQGKGHGLVINLFGPPGVGKTLSAEATSEHVRRPLYVIGGGDLGTQAAELDQALEQVFDIATSWKAIVLIDEADVFLEERSLHDLERNAMVAVFLRHVEYYRGILFMTTNRIKTFDEAFLSRIHVALHFQELSKSAKKQVWVAFLKKVGVEEDDIGAEFLERLAERNINGRQIKNATRTANSLAASKGEKLGFSHLAETLDAMEEFTSEFAAMGRNK
ncbi:ATPase family AAA domain-containing protein 3B [Grifola frondosa]|uniref:ATPase family AAA domain-containing protein 3B n=1 Tax=Grifola frondosa TaxID=5627 RepID=A0A1C7MPG7_GRIFR|nr:ATPase family AAA domain-containing protein 3B [Grifola frondosa]